MPIEKLIQRIEGEERLDRIADRLEPLVRRRLGDGTVRDALAGTSLGHPAHPLAVTAPIGFFLGATLLDLVGGKRCAPAARRLIGWGILSAAPAAASGAGDWVDTRGAERRVGVVHAVANNVALGLFCWSWLRRRHHRRAAGMVAGLAGTAVLGIGGFLGGHLTFRRGVGVATTVFEAGPQQWSRALPFADLADGRPVGLTIDGVALVAVRDGGAISVLENRCTHRGGPLHEGRVEEGTIVCPWHASRFCLSDGSVQRGPASAPQPVYECRVRDGWVEVRRPEPGRLRTEPTEAERALQIVRP